MIVTSLTSLLLIVSPYYSTHHYNHSHYHYHYHSVFDAYHDQNWMFVSYDNDSDSDSGSGYNDKQNNNERLSTVMV